MWPFAIAPCLLFRCRRQHIQFSRAGQKAAVPNRIGVDASFGRKRVGNLARHQCQAGALDLTKPLGAGVSTVDRGVNRQFQAPCFKLDIDDAVALFDKLDGCIGFDKYFFHAFGGSSQKGANRGGVFLDHFG